MAIGQKWTLPQRWVNPNWLAEELTADKMIPGGAKIDGSSFLAIDAIKVTLSANAAQGATSLAVGAITTYADGRAIDSKAVGVIPSGALLDAGTGKLAITTAAVDYNATAIPVRAIPTAMSSGDVATYSGKGVRSVPQGTLVGRTFAERDAGTPLGPWTSGDEEVYLVAFDVLDVTELDEVALVRNQALIKENWLPDWANYSAQKKAALRSKYQVVRGN